MQGNIQLLEKKSIDAALNKDWETAVTLNTKILEKYPNNKNAKIRLGRAYLKTKKFTEAKKIFKEILEIDPINSIARKNYKLASEKNSDNKAEAPKEDSTKVLIKEPGTTTQIDVQASESLLSKLEPGQKINLKSYKTKIVLFLGKKEIGTLDSKVANVVYNAKKDDLEVTATIVKPNKNHFTLSLKCKKPIFKSEKQRENPYLNKDVVGDDIEIPELEKNPEE